MFWRSQGISDSVIGLLIAEGIVAEVVLFAWGRRLVERLGPAGLTACAATASADALERHRAARRRLPVLVVVQLLHAATFAMQHLSAMLVLSRAVPPERAATAQALHAALGYGAPTGLLMLLAGLLYARFGGAGVPGDGGDRWFGRCVGQAVADGDGWAVMGFAALYPSPPELPHQFAIAGAATLAPLNAGITSLANHSSCSSAIGLAARRPTG